MVNCGVFNGGAYVVKIIENIELFFLKTFIDLVYNRIFFYLNFFFNNSGERLKLQENEFRCFSLNLI